MLLIKCRGGGRRQNVLTKTWQLTSHWAARTKTLKYLTLMVEKSYLDGTHWGGGQRLQILRVQNVSRPCSEHFQKLNGNSLCLPCWIRRRCGVEERLTDAVIPRTAWPSCTVITIFQSRRRWRCDHVPIVSKGNGDALFRYIKKTVKA